MPKKSKREKIRADVRRRTLSEISIRIPQVVPQTHEDHALSFQFTAKPLQREESLETRSHDDVELTAIKKDLTKTAVLATIAIAAEFALYIANIGK